MIIKDHLGRPKKYDFRLKKGEFREIQYTKSARDIVYKTAKKLGYKVCTKVVGDILQIERQ